MRVNPATNKLYIKRWGPGGLNPGWVEVVDAASNTLLTSIQLSAGHDLFGEVAINSVTNRIYAIGGQGFGVIDVIDGATDTLLTTISPGVLNPRGVAVDESRNLVYAVSSSGTSQLLVIDGATNTVINSLPGSSFVGSVAVEEVANRIFVLTGAGVLVVDGASLSVLTTIPTGYVQHSCLDPVASRLYVANGFEPFITVIDTGSLAVVGTLDLSVDCSIDSQSLDAANGTLYLSPVNGLDQRVVVFDVNLNAEQGLTGYTVEDGAGVVAHNPATGVQHYLAGNAAWTVEPLGCAPHVFAQPYCTPGTTADGCTPQISGSGAASGTSGSGFDITVSQAPGMAQGTIFYGIRGPKTSVWNNGSGFAFVCVQAPYRRMGASNSGGTPGSCDGTFTIDWNAFVAANPGTFGDPFLPGETVWAQCWFRDPGNPGNTSFSDALRFTVEN